MNKRQVGTQYESMAVQYLTEAGYHILERNFRCRTGEIDIIAKDGAYLVFVEVKYRASAACGSALEAVDYRKQQSILRVAQYYMVSHGYGTQTNCRFDVVAIQGTEITLIQNAFGA
ncbi:MAG: YraN family protein [Lachnospiraceae bacterium]|nr:YraN family protein [Lachnospiraceae bacterium]MDD7333248.1 YraN family protein [Lachnospiraceae bacterium]MDY5102780.1 YraN family protein [Agathobacter sp.]MDY5521946.1 YraN family protein [Agathobacter sp.]